MLEPHHKLRVAGERGALKLEADLAFAAPWTVIFGPSGSGKSSFLRALCGLLPNAEVAFSRREDSTWTDLHQVPTSRRALAYAPQGGTIFPHMSVARNIAFAAQSAKGARGDDPATQAALAAAVDLFAMTPLLARLPRSLSGGERQGVSLARAFAVPYAKLMLLDEPFNGIDHTMRSVLLPRMVAALAKRNIPAISVTHDVEEALMLNAWVIRIDGGKVLAQGPAKEVLAPERERMLRVLHAHLPEPLLRPSNT
jgi:molybdate transport system ATP-binding protein